MKRRAFNVLALVSLLMAIAVAGMWARSVWWATGRVSVSIGEKRLRLAMISGQILIAYFPAHWEEGIYEGNVRPNPRGMNLPTDPSSTRWKPLDWEHYFDNPHLRYGADDFHVESASDVTTTSDSFTIADWLLIFAFSILPTAWLLVRIRDPKAVGHCAKCGYDLRGSPGPACPECGTAIAAKA